MYLTIFYSNPTSIFLNHVYVVKNKKKYNTVIFFFKYQTSSSCGEFTKYRLWRGSGTPRRFSEILLERTENVPDVVVFGKV